MVAKPLSANDLAFVTKLWFFTSQSGIGAPEWLRLDETFGLGIDGTTNLPLHGAVMHGCEWIGLTIYLVVLSFRSTKSRNAWVKYTLEVTEAGVSKVASTAKPIVHHLEKPSEYKRRLDSPDLWCPAQRCFLTWRPERLLELRKKWLHKFDGGNQNGKKKKKKKTLAANCRNNFPVLCQGLRYFLSQYFILLRCFFAVGSLDNFAAGQLDKLETNYPIIKKPTGEVSSWFEFANSSQKRSSLEKKHWWLDVFLFFFSAEALCCCTLNRPTSTDATSRLYLSPDRLNLFNQAAICHAESGKKFSGRNFYPLPWTDPWKFYTLVVSKTKRNPTLLPALAAWKLFALHSHKLFCAQMFSGFYFVLWTTTGSYYLVEARVILYPGSSGDEESVQQDRRAHGGTRWLRQGLQRQQGVRRQGLLRQHCTFNFSLIHSLQ